MGRNTPCPCGSKLKYKRCCAQGFTREDVACGLEALRHLAESWVGASDRMWDLFHGTQVRPPGPGRPEDEVFLDWLYFDARDDRGLRVIDLFLHTDGLSRGVRAYAAAMRDSALRLYDVNVQRRGSQTVLRDLLTGESLVVTGGVEDGVTLLAARVVARGESGRAEYHGTSLAFPGFLRTELVGLLRDEVAILRREGGGVTRDERKSLAPILFRRWSSLFHPSPSSATEPTPVRTDAEREAAELRLHAQYAGWLDTVSDRLAGATPRAAAASPELQPRLVELLRELEAEYGLRLTLDEPAFDPSLLWDDLNLRVLRDGPSDRPPPLGHETMASLVPGLSDVAVEVARQHRDSRNRDLEWTIPSDIIARDPRVHRFLQEHIHARVQQGAELEPIHAGVRLLAAHVGLLSNFELHLRKVVWVDEKLSWMFSASSLDEVDGEELRLPFGCMALVFTDRYALGLAERLLARVPGEPLRGRILRVLTAYLHNVTLAGGRRGIRVVFTCDADGDEWPAVIGRDFPIVPEARVVDILRSEAPGVDGGELAPIWSCVPLRHLLHLVVHAVLEVTSTRGQWIVREPAPSQSEPRPHTRRTEERVFELPGSIDIKVYRAIREAKRGAVSSVQIHQCLVRGYRRRASPGWKDQRKRWVKPYWRGPEDGPIVERPYRLLP